MNERGYKKYLIAVLMALAAFNYVDRAVMGLVLQDIKIEFALSDTQLGLLTGIAFALFYSVMGIPIARWADRGNRVTIISLAATLASAGMALCATATNFLQLLLIRITIAVGEAGCVPPAHSLIADYFNRSERPRAVSIYKLGLPLSVIIGFFGAGWLNELYGWRTTFVLLGLPGLALALVARLTLREPRLTMHKINDATETFVAAKHPSLKVVFITLWDNVTFRHVLLAYSVIIFFGAGRGQWTPTFFIRTFGLGSGELGTWIALIVGGTGLLGIYMGGVLASRYAASNERLQLKAMALITIVVMFFLICEYLSPNSYLAFTFMGLGTVVGFLITGPTFALIQTLVPERMRAIAIAVVFLLSNLIGMGFGPLLAGALSDALMPAFGVESLRYALLALCPGSLWAAWHFWRSSKTVIRDLEAARLQGGS